MFPSLLPAPCVLLPAARYLSFAACSRSAFVVPTAVCRLPTAYCRLPSAVPSPYDRCNLPKCRVGMEDGRPPSTPPHRTVLTVLPYTARGRMLAIPADEGLLRPLEPPTRFGSGTPHRSFHRETRFISPALSKYALPYL